MKSDKISRKITAKTVEKEIKKQFGYDVNLINGRGYFYFIDDDGNSLDSWSTTSVMVNSLNQLSLEQWVEEFKWLMNDNK